MGRENFTPNPNQSARYQNAVVASPLSRVALLVLLGAAYLGGSIWRNHFLSDGQLSRLISRKTAVILHADSAGYLPLSWSGLSVRSGGLLVKGKPDRGLAEICATGLRASCRLDGLLRRKWTISELQAEHLQAAFGAAAAKLIREDLPEPPPMEAAIETASPLTLEILETRVAHTDIFWGQDEKSVGGFRNVQTLYYPRDKNLDVKGTGGTFRQTGWPEFKVNRVEMHYASPKLQVRTVDLALGSGNLTITGELDFGEAQRMTLQMRSSHSPIEPFLTGKWSGKAEGIFDGDTTVDKKLGPDGETHAQGSIRLIRGVLHGWETLDKIAEVTKRPECHRLPVSEFKADYTWSGKRLEVKKLRAESRGLICVEGSFRLEGETIEGTFEIGATESVLEAIPGAREDVFTASHDGYFWTTMHLSGLMGHPREDLKGRLVTAAEKHFTKGILGKLFKPGQVVIDLLKTLYQ